MLAGLPSLFSEQAAQELAEKEEEWEKEREALYAEIGRLTTHVTWLEKNLAQGLSRQERRNLVDWENQELSVRTQAELLSLNRSVLYYRPVPPSPQEVALKHRIDEIYTAHCYYGSRRSAAQSRSAPTKAPDEIGVSLMTWEILTCYACPHDK